MKTILFFWTIVMCLSLAHVNAQDSDGSPTINFSFPTQIPQFTGSTSEYDQTGVFQHWKKLTAPEGVLAFRDDDVSSYYVIFYLWQAGQTPTVENVGFTNANLQEQAPETSNNITFYEKVGTATLKKTGEKVWVSATTFSIDGTNKYYMICYGDGADDTLLAKDCAYKRKETLKSIKPIGSQ